MRAVWFAAGALAWFSGSCIAPSVLAPEDRALSLAGEDVEWQAGTQADLPGTYVSTELTGPLAVALRKLVYLFEPEGTYSGAGLIDGETPYFEVIGGVWSVDADGLHLDDGPPATLEVAHDGSLRLSGEEGRVVLRRERSQ